MGKTKNTKRREISRRPNLKSKARMNRPKNQFKNLKNKRKDQQVVQKESKLDFELQPDYSIPTNLQIAEDDFKLFASLTSEVQTENIYQQISKDFQSFEQKEILSNPAKDPEVKAVYLKVGELLSKYRDGKVPDCFSVLPRVAHWESLVQLTSPEKWTPHAFFKTTRLFVASPESKQTLYYFKYYLLPRVLSEIARTGKLNYHLFQSLKKGLYRPALWFRGILFPFLKGNYREDFALGKRPEINSFSLGTLKQAQIIAAVLMKTSLPNLHASAALLKILSLEYTGPVGVLIKLFIDKKFALPLSVIRELSQWFLRFQHKEQDKMPVLWFQTLFSFAKSYRKHLQEQEKTDLKKLVKKKLKHHQLSSEIIQVLSLQEPVQLIPDKIQLEE